MPQPNKSLHEAQLSNEVLDRHRAISSIMEELEAVDWYDQRAEAASCDELRAILQHNRDEEKEHAAMVLEWLRRKDRTFDTHLRAFLFSDGPIREQRSDRPTKSGASSSSDSSLGIGSLKE